MAQGNLTLIHSLDIVALDRLVVAGERCEHIDTEVAETDMDGMEDDGLPCLRAAKSPHPVVAFVQLDVVVAPVFYDIMILMVSCLQQFAPKQDFLAA